MNYTSKYRLGKPLSSERYSVSVFNSNFDTIDAQLNTLATKLNSLEYKSGDTYTIDGHYGYLAVGEITNGCSVIVFTVPLAKPVASEVTTLTCTTLRANIRPVSGGYLFTDGVWEATGYDILAHPTFSSIETKLIGDRGAITVTVRLSEGLASPPQTNTPLVIDINKMVVNFS